MTRGPRSHGSPPARPEEAGPNLSTDICIVGAGPAGLMAAIGAAAENVATTLLEANANAGHKLLVTGGGRCNFTHAATIDEFVRAFGKGGRFLRHSFHNCSASEIRAFFAERGIPSEVEPDGCVFPIAHRATDIRNALVREAEKLGARPLCGSPVTQIVARDSGFQIDTQARRILARQLIVATGGLSWPQTGSTGDGYRFAGALGHAAVATKPSLVPLIVREKWPADLAGVSVRDIALRAKVGGRKVLTQGHMVFTYDGIGGAAPQDLSRALADALAEQPAEVEVRIDLIPTTNETELDLQLQEKLARHSKKRLVNILAGFVPKRLAAMLCHLAQCDSECPSNQVKKQTRRRLAALVKSLGLHVTGTRPIAEATVTRGGVSLKQIDPRTMESKVCPGLYFAGEVIDADGPCGGYNLQMCFATGRLAGRSAADSLVNPTPPA